MAKLCLAPQRPCRLRVVCRVLYFLQTLPLLLASAFDRITVVIALLQLVANPNTLLTVSIPEEFQDSAVLDKVYTLRCQEQLFRLAGPGSFWSRPHKRWQPGVSDGASTVTFSFFVLAPNPSTVHSIQLEGLSPLHAASKLGKVKVVSALLAGGASHAQYSVRHGVTVYSSGHDFALSTMRLSRATSSFMSLTRPDLT
jgi:hypothetical protein